MSGGAALTPLREARSRAPGPGAIDWSQVRAPLIAALRGNMRSGGRVLASRSRKPRGLIFLMALYALMGASAGALAFTRPDLFTWAFILHGMTLFMGGMTLVAESPNLLFNVQEQEVLGHRPIGPRTLLVARALRLLGLALVLTLSLNLFPMFFALAVRGAPPWVPLVHLVATVLLTVFCAGLVVLVNVLLTRWVGRERFDSLATWVQVAVSIFFIAGYQIVPRLMDRAHGLRVNAGRPFMWALPPAWFATLENALTGRLTGAHAPWMIVAALAAPLLIGWAALGRLAEGYTERLTSLGETPVSRRPVRARAAGPGLRALEPLLRAWMPDPVERGAFRLAAAYMRRDRDMRMRLYPSLGPLVVFPLLPLFDSKTGATSGPVLWLILASTLPMTTMMTLKMSPHYAAADLFRYTPMRGAAALFHGVRKAVLLLVVFPALVASGAILWFTVPRHELLLDTLPCLIALPTLSLMLGLAGGYLPLSVSPTVGRQAGTNVGSIILGSLMTSVLYAAGFIARQFGWFWPLIGVEVVALVITHLLLLRGIRARPLAAE